MVLGSGPVVRAAAALVGSGDDSIGVWGYFGPSEETLGVTAAATITLLDRFGPGSSGAPVSPDEARRYVRGLADSHYENFSVLSRLVPERLRDDFAAVYAYCRWSDDLGDETGTGDSARARSLELLGWWRGELRKCFARAERPEADGSGHPVFVALEATVRRHRLAIAPFEHLIDAFEQDQRVTRYQTWEEVCDYCTRSADPVGRIVLALDGHGDWCGRDAELTAMSDATCTALQLTNFWQDVRRDLSDRDRVYLPERETGINGATLREWAQRADDPAARVPYIRAVRPLVERTRALFVKGRPLPRALGDEMSPVVWLFGAGGEAVLSAVERIGCATLWRRPRLAKWKKASLVLAAGATRWRWRAAS